MPILWRFSVNDVPVRETMTDTYRRKKVMIRRVATLSLGVYRWKVCSNLPDYQVAEAGCPRSLKFRTGPRCHTSFRHDAFHSSIPTLSESSSCYSLVMALNSFPMARICSRRPLATTIRSSGLHSPLRRNAHSISTSTGVLRPRHITPNTCRSFATETTGQAPTKPPGSIQISTLFTGLLVVGTGITAYGLYVSLSFPPILARQKGYFTDPF